MWSSDDREFLLMARLRPAFCTSQLQEDRGNSPTEVASKMNALEKVYCLERKRGREVTLRNSPYIHGACKVVFIAMSHAAGETEYRFSSNAYNTAMIQPEPEEEKYGTLGWYGGFSVLF